MSEMGDANVIATLIAQDSDLARRGFQLSHNRDRYLPPTSIDVPLSSRESTPFPEGDEGEPDDTKDRLQLSFSFPPKSARGFVFGWDPDCDIQLVDRKNLLPRDARSLRYISRKHFYIAFDTERRLIVRDTSTSGLSVSYDGQARDEVRSHFTWIIFKHIKEIEVRIPHANFWFRIELSTNHSHEEFLASVDAMFPPKLREEQNDLTSPMLQLDVHSRNTSVVPSGMATPRHGPIYILDKAIGQGAFGKVYKVLDVSTGDVYAGKAFDQLESDREATILREVKQEHIVRFVDFRQVPTPLIVMEYMPLGSLADAHHTCPINFIETLTILDQALQAMDYLNCHGYVHRDIKPANILVSCRNPLAIKLADFGLAKHNRNGQSQFRTFAGTKIYAAPEIHNGGSRPYTYAVDIWSLGIVALELAYGLPQVASREFNSRQWFRRVSNFVQTRGSDILIDFLSVHMLQYQPENRLSAGECLTKVLEIKRAFEGPSTQAPFLTEVAPVPNTLVRESKTSSKRERSPDSDSRIDSSKRTTIRTSDHHATRCAQIYAIANASLFYSGQQGAMYESVLELLKDIQLDGDEIMDPHSIAPIQSLCYHLELLEITEIMTCTDLEAERTILTAVTETGEFTLARLTPSDLANSIADLAHHLSVIMRLSRLDPLPSHHGHFNRHSSQDSEISRSSHIWDPSSQTEPVEDDILEGSRTPTRASPFARLEDSPDSSTNDDDSWLTGPSQGLTYPSALLDVLNVSGCSFP